MGVKSRARRIINRIISPFGIKIIALTSDTSMLNALKNIKKRGYLPSSIIDVGASNGKWSLMAYTIFPDAHFLLVEPLPENKSAISELVQKNKNWHYCAKAAGNETGTISINITEDLDGSAVILDNQGFNNVKQFKMTTVDSVCEDIGLPPPYLVKLDTHGFEKPILDGMKNIWNRIDFLIIEAYNFKLHAECLRFFDLATFLEKRGFLPVDIVDIRHRPGDLLFWQMDIAFAKKDQKEFKIHTYNI